MLSHITSIILWLVAAIAAQPTSDAIEPRVDKIFAPWSAPGSPGVAVGVYRDGAIVLTKGYGLAHLEHDVPITAETAFYLGSVSKQFVATAVLLLVQDGQLALDDDVHKHVPELPDYGSPITVRHLLHHTSGLRDYLNLLSLAGRTVDHYHDDDQIIAILARQESLNFDPGTRHAYSNSGYFLLNVIVERVSGKPLREFAEQRIFKPLGMTNTHFHDDYTHIIPHRAMGYFPGLGKTYKQFMNTFDLVGSGGVYSNVTDLFRWEQNFHDHTVGGMALHQAQHQRGRLSNGEQLQYAAGLVHGQHRGLDIVEHAGALGGYRSVLLRFPAQRLAVVVLANLSSVNPAELARRVADLYLADAFPEEASQEPATDSPTLIERTAAELEPHAGHYWNRSLALIREIKLDSGTLYYVRGPFSRNQLGATGPNTFEMMDVGEHVPVVLSKDTMSVTSPGDGTNVFQRYTPHEVTADELAELAGSYHSPELDSSFQLDAVDKALLLRSPDRRLPLRPVIRDVFAMSRAGVLLAIQRDDAGQASGFQLHAGGVRGLLFEREAE